jgi:NADPH:quinone reductase-like Zn-dependent oxidoreductase
LDGDVDVAKKVQAKAVASPSHTEAKPAIRVTTHAGPGSKPVMHEVPWPKVPPKGALIKIGACGVCGTDQHILKGHWPKALPWPFTLGHELAGVIVEIDVAAVDAVWILRMVQTLSRTIEQVPDASVLWSLPGL